MSSIVKGEQLAEIFSCDIRTIQRYVSQKGMPKLDANTYDKDVCFKWLINLLKDEIKDLKAGEETLNQAKLRNINANTEMRELELEEKKANLISAKLVEEAFLNEAKIIGKRLEVLPVKIAPRLEGLDQKEMIITLTKEIDEIRNQIGNLPVQLTTNKDESEFN